MEDDEVWEWRALCTREKIRKYVRMGDEHAIAVLSMGGVAARMRLFGLRIFWRLTGNDLSDSGRDRP